MLFWRWLEWRLCLLFFWFYDVWFYWIIECVSWGVCVGDLVGGESFLVEVGWWRWLWFWGIWIVVCGGEFWGCVVMLWCVLYWWYCWFWLRVWWSLVLFWFWLFWWFYGFVVFECWFCCVIVSWFLYWIVLMFFGLLCWLCLCLVLMCWCWWWLSCWVLGCELVCFVFWRFYGWDF